MKYANPQSSKLQHNNVGKTNVQLVLISAHTCHQTMGSWKSQNALTSWLSKWVLLLEWCKRSWNGVLNDWMKIITTFRIPLYKFSIQFWIFALARTRLTFGHVFPLVWTSLFWSRLSLKHFMVFPNWQHALAPIGKLWKTKVIKRWCKTRTWEKNKQI